MKIIETNIFFINKYKKYKNKYKKMVKYLRDVSSKLDKNDKYNWSLSGGVHGTNKRKRDDDDDQNKSISKDIPKLAEENEIIDIEEKEDMDEKEEIYEREDNQNIQLGKRNELIEKYEYNPKKPKIIEYKQVSPLISSMKFKDKFVEHSIEPILKYLESIINYKTKETIIKYKENTSKYDNVDCDQNEKKMFSMISFLMDNIESDNNGSDAHVFYGEDIVCRIGLSCGGSYFYKTRTIRDIMKVELEENIKIVPTHYAIYELYDCCGKDLYSDIVIMERIFDKGFNKEIYGDKLCNIVNLLHQYKIAHGDLNYNNILVSPDDDILLIDFDYNTKFPIMFKSYQESDISFLNKIKEK